MTPVSSVKTTVSYVKIVESYEVFRLGHHMDSTFTGKDQNRPNNSIGPCTAAVACLLLLFRRLDCYMVKYKLISPTNKIIIIAI